MRIHITRCRFGQGIALTWRSWKEAKCDWKLVMSPVGPTAFHCSSKARRSGCHSWMNSRLSDLSSQSFAAQWITEGLRGSGAIPKISNNDTKQPRTARLLRRVSPTKDEAARDMVVVIEHLPSNRGRNHWLVCSVNH